MMTGFRQDRIRTRAETAKRYPCPHRPECCYFFDSAIQDRLRVKRSL
jgi:hypothetical protein